MATTHGRRAYFQLLLGPHRGELFDKLASDKDQKATAYMRDVLYTHLEKVLPSSVYREAVAMDEASWKQSVRRRVEGRQRSRAESSKTQTDASETV